MKAHALPGGAVATMGRQEKVVARRQRDKRRALGLGPPIAPWANIDARKEKVQKKGPESST